MVDCRSLVAGLLATAIAGPACATSTTEADVATGSESALVVGANSDFDSELRGLESIARQCEAEGRCESDGGLRQASTTLGLTETDHLAGGTDSRGVSFSRVKLCDTLRPLAAFETPYVFVGASAKAALIRSVSDGGVDVVFDLGHRQVAVFYYQNHGVQNLVGAEANVYFGYAFGKKKDVVDAWSGEFQTAEVTVETPYLNLSAGGAIFRSPDSSLWGALVEVSVGVNALGPLGVVEVGASEGHWTAWDKATTALGSAYWHVSYSPVRAEAQRSHAYLQFAKGRDAAFALVQTLGGLGFAPAAQTLALEALQNRGLTLAAACGR
jgi:hypothetical protein